MTSNTDEINQMLDKLAALIQKLRSQFELLDPNDRERTDALEMINRIQKKIDQKRNLPEE